MFSYFESSVDGIIPNEYSSLESICMDLFGCVASARDSCMLTARRVWLAKQLVSPELSKKIFSFSFNKDESMANSARNHPELVRSKSYQHLTKSKGANDNDTMQSLTFNNLNNSNNKLQKDKKQI